MPFQKLERVLSHPVPQVLEHEVDNLILIALQGQVVTNSGEGLVQDGEEHVEEDEHHEHHVEEEVDGSKYAVRFLQHFELSLTCGREQRTLVRLIRDSEHEVTRGGHSRVKHK